MGRRGTRGWAAVGLGAALLLGACGFGATGAAEDVLDVEATLTATAGSTEAGTVTYWFEYGRTDTYGSATPAATTVIDDPETTVAVEAAVGGLDPSTTHHYRVCVDDAEGHGACGADMTFTTEAPRDRVSGTGVVFSMPELGWTLGARVDASISADGSGLEGTAAALPGAAYFRLVDEGPVTCLRVEGNRAAIGLVADHTDVGGPVVARLIFVEDNGPTGDALAYGSIELPATTCPVPTADDLTAATVGGLPVGPVLASGDFVVTDAT